MQPSKHNAAQCSLPCTSFAHAVKSLISAKSKPSGYLISAMEWTMCNFSEITEGQLLVISTRPDELFACEFAGAPAPRLLTNVLHRFAMTRLPSDLIIDPSSLIINGVLIYEYNATIYNP